MVIQHVLPTEAGEDAIVTHVNSSSTVGEVGTEKSAGVSESDQYLSSWRLAIVITSLCLGTFLIALDINIIGVAVPKIATTFRSLDDVAWYGSAYLLTVTAFQPVMGFSYKYFSMLATYLICVATFEGEDMDAVILPLLVLSEMLIRDRGRKWARCCALRLRAQSCSLLVEPLQVLVLLDCCRALYASSDMLSG